MTNEQLVARIQAGENTAENMLQLWKNNQCFIQMFAKRYKGLAELEDLEQEGYLALYEAVDKYKAENGCKFLTYAGQWIKQYMTRYIQNNSTTVRIPIQTREKIKEYNKVVNIYKTSFGRKPTRHEIAQSMGLSVDAVVLIEKAETMLKLSSLDICLTDGEVGGTMSDIIADDVDIEADALEAVQQEQLKAVIWTAVDTLPEQQRQVIHKRFKENRDLKQVGESLGISLESVRKVQNKAIRALQRRRELKGLLTDDDTYSMGIKGTGVNIFNSTWTSSTERAALARYGSE